MNKENEGKRNRNQSDKGGKYEHFGDTDVKRRKIFQEKWSCQQCQMYREHNKDKTIGFTKYEAIEKCCESVVCGVLELSAMLFGFEHISGMRDKG